MEKDWENPKVFGINKEPGRSYFTHFPEDERDWKISLNGTWKFNWVAKPADRPLNFYGINFPVDSWDEIEVPELATAKPIVKKHLTKYLKLKKIVFDDDSLDAHADAVIELIEVKEPFFPAVTIALNSWEQAKLVEEEE